MPLIRQQESRERDRESEREREREKEYRTMMMIHSNHQLKLKRSCTMALWCCRRSLGTSAARVWGWPRWAWISTTVSCGAKSGWWSFSAAGDCDIVSKRCDVRVMPLTFFFFAGCWCRLSFEMNWQPSLPTALLKRDLQTKLSHFFLNFHHFEGVRENRGQKK